MAAVLRCPGRALRPAGAGASRVWRLRRPALDPLDAGSRDVLSRPRRGGGTRSHPSDRQFARRLARRRDPDPRPRAVQEPRPAGAGRPSRQRRPVRRQFHLGAGRSVRNLYHDQSFADRILAVKPSDEQMDVMLKNRFTVAKFGWQPRWFNPDLEKWLHRIKLPALIVWGDDDKIMPREYADLWQQRLPDARLVRVKECGHLPHVEIGRAHV